MTGLRFAIRQLLKNPGFTGVAVLTLALGIGANTAIFSFVDYLLVRAMPVTAPHELVNLGAQQDGEQSFTFNYPLYADYRDHNRVFAGLITFAQRSLSLGAAGESTRVQALVVSGNFFSVLGIQPALGRGFTTEEELEPGAQPAVVIGHGLWLRQFAGDPAVLGRTVALNGLNFTVVGVTPAEFTGTMAGLVAEAYVPILVSSQLSRNEALPVDPLQSRFFTWLHIMGRLQPGVSRVQAQLAMQSLNQELARMHPENAPANVVLVDGRQGANRHLEPARLPLWLTQAAMWLVLLIACTNVANMLLARASERRKEMAIRLALGAGRRQLIRQLLTESLVLAALSGAAGLIVGWWFTRALATFLPSGGLSLVQPMVDGRVVGFTLLLAAMTGVCFGLVPALQISRPALLAGIKDTAPALLVLNRRWSLRNLLVVAQCALSLVVLIGAGLCLRSVRNLQTVATGFEPDRVVLASFDLPNAGYAPDRGTTFYQQLQERARALPGVESASLASSVVLDGQTPRISIERIEGYAIPPDEFVNLSYNIVTPGYFRTLNVPVLGGRDFEPADADASRSVVIINQTLAKTFWPDQDPVGRRIYLRDVKQGGEIAREVVGVVGDSKYRDLAEGATPMMFWPLTPSHRGPMTLHLLSSANPGALIAGVRTLFASLDSNVPLFNVLTLAQQQADSILFPRMAATCLSGVGLLGLLLAALGLYGVTALAVGQRRREFGIRIALGAQRSQLLRLVLKEGTYLVATGLGIGLLGGLTAAQVLRGFLFGVSPFDPLTFAGVSLVLGAAALLACLIPARRAAKIDPQEALRQQ
jgi:predicted permease